MTAQATLVVPTYDGGTLRIALYAEGQREPVAVAELEPLYALQIASKLLGTATQALRDRETVR